MLLDDIQVLVWDQGVADYNYKKLPNEEAFGRDVLSRKVKFV